MIKSFRHKGLKRFYETCKRSGIRPQHTDRLRMQLTALDTAQSIDDMNVPGFKIHRLRGRAQSRWAIWVSGNWRLTFEFEEGNVHFLDYEDDH